ncbi:hypothetical protein FZZ93_18045 [Halomonas eurihalina]|uniref:Uncharacterized protein n=1 Tax=Halomonas eurihalina TaxID=42566 RepID=A0A5D9CH50_HALER|nr:hypothetical protein [Halomonas eurihalina]MDR5860465.1 hypothetical protein [Halomonas eurihalina]TZG30756.1 hypothetical protein FZZ93_18045 [Halomonas eurihalina]
MTTQAKEQDASGIALRVGEYLTRGPNELYALSPKPIPLGPTAGAGADVGRLIYRRDEATLDLLHNVSRNAMLAWGGAAVWMMFALLGVFLFVAFGAVTGASSWLEAWGMWGGGAYMAILLFTVGGLWLPDLWIRGNAPVRFHRQRREVAFVVEHPGRRVFLPSPSAHLMYGFWFALFSMSGAMAVFELGDLGDVEKTSHTLFFLGLHLLFFPALAIGYVALYRGIRRLAGWRKETVFVPWEDVVAVATRNMAVTVGGPAGIGWELHILPPDPERPGYSLAGAGISANVTSLQMAMMQWELIRRYMEEGPEAVPERADDYSMAWYKDEMARQRRRHEREGKPFWRYRLGRWMELAYFASWYTEYRVNHVLPKAIPKGWIEEWSQPLPEAEWAKPSEELTDLSRQVEAAYERGKTFLDLGPVEERFGQSGAGEVPKAAYRSVPFAAHSG